MKTRMATKEYFEARQQAMREMKDQYNLSQKQMEVVFNSYVSIERIKEICNFQLSKERFSEFFLEAKSQRVEIYCESEKKEEIKKETYKAIVYRQWNSWVLSDRETEQLPYYIQTKAEVREYLQNRLDNRYPGKYKLWISWA